MKKAIFLLISVVLLFVGCNTESTCMTNIDTPSGVILMTEHINAVIGETFKIHFRVNPSNYVISKEMLQLDCTKSYSNAKSAYVQENPRLEIVSVMPSQGDNGEILSGEWVATVTAKEEATTYEEISELYIVLTVKLLDNKSMSITSSNKTTISVIPSISKEQIAIHTPYAQSYKTSAIGEPSYLSASVSISAVVQETALQYSLQWIDRAEVVLLNHTDQFTVTSTRNANEIHFDITPLGDLFAGISERVIPFNIKINLTDKTGQTYSEERTIRFCNSHYTIKAAGEFIIRRGDLTGAMIDMPIDMSALLPLVGITPEFFTQHRGFLSTAIASENYDSEFDPNNRPPIGGFELADDPNPEDPTTFSNIVFTNIIDMSITVGKYYAVIYITLTDPNNGVMISAEIMQEISII